MAETPISGGSNPSSSSSSSLGSRNNNNPNYHQLNLAGKLLSYRECYSVANMVIVTVSRATLDPAHFLKKPSAYVEVVIDGKSIRKTDAVKSSHEPVWCNETFTV